MTADMSTGNRHKCPASGAGKVYGVGCLPFLFVWLLLDLIGKAIIWGIASLFGKKMPPFSTAMQCTAWAVLIPLAGIFIAILVFWLYLIIADLVDEFRKGKKKKAIEDHRKD